MKYCAKIGKMTYHNDKHPEHVLRNHLRDFCNLWSYDKPCIRTLRTWVFIDDNKR